MIWRTLLGLIALGLMAAKADYPHFAQLPKDAPDAFIFQIQVDESATPTVAQRIPDTQTIVWMTDGPVKKWQLANLSGAIRDSVQCNETDDTLELLTQGEPILRYHKSIQMGPKGTDPAYHRSGYIHPVYSPAGQEITGDFAADHPHQHGLFFAWTNSAFEGRPINFWDQKKGQGRISHQKVISKTSGPVFAQFQVQLLYEDLSAPGGSKPVLHETWTVRAYATMKGGFLFDLQSDQQCASDSPLVINQYHYGAMAIRGNDQWMDEEYVPAIRNWEKAKKKDPNAPPPDFPDLPREYLTSEGKMWHDGNHTPARWVAMFGAIDERAAGIAVLSHPGNFRATQKVRLHPSKPYFCFAPMIDGEFKILPGQTFTSRYRYLAYAGETSSEMIDKQWKQYARTR